MSNQDTKEKQAPGQEKPAVPFSLPPIEVGMIDPLRRGVVQ